METTLLVGDHLLVNKFIFGGHGAWYEKLLPYRPLERGDIIVFKYPYQDHTHYVKRVIGLPGDHLKIVDQRVFVNGKLLNEPYVVHDPAVGYDPLNYNFPPQGIQLYSSPVIPEWAREIKKLCAWRRNRRAAGEVFCDGRQSRSQLRQPLLGIC